MSVLKIPKNV